MKSLVQSDCQPFFVANKSEDSAGSISMGISVPVVESRTKYCSSKTFNPFLKIFYHGMQKIANTKPLAIPIAQDGEGLLHYPIRRGGLTPR